MKNKIFILGLAFSFGLNAQQNPTGSGNTTVTPNVANSSYSWFRGGNLSGGAAGTNNIFGTLWNSPIYTVTNGVTRTKLNGNVTYPVNGYNLARNGFMLIGNDGPLLTGAGNIYTAKGAYSLLHLNGEGTDVQELGYRPWMRTGLTLTGNSDLSYFGLRPIGGAEDRTETVITWSDNQSGIADELVFRFTGQIQNGSITESTDFASADDLDGLHIGRFTPGGLFGLGNTFGHIDQTAVAPFFNTPRSLLHLSYQYRSPTASDLKLFEQYGFMQITYRRQNSASSDFIGQGEQVTDGLRLGIDNQAFFGGPGASIFLNSYLRWQEQSSFIIQTESSTDNNIQNDERIRITSVAHWLPILEQIILGILGLIIALVLVSVLMAICQLPVL